VGVTKSKKEVSFLAPTAIEKSSIARARKLRRSMTQGEKRLWLALREFRKTHGFHVRKQVPIGPCIADFAIHSARLIIEVDGDLHSEPDNRTHDEKRDAWFARAGYKTLRFTTGALAGSFDGCIEQILRELGIIP
jgi:very-short-patch-repair endonuclease